MKYSKVGWLIVTYSPFFSADIIACNMMYFLTKANFSAILEGFFIN